MKNYITYTNLRKNNYSHLPSTVQNMILREYCKKMKLKFSLPVEEYIFENCFVELEGILSNLKKTKGLIICSIDMIPNDREYYKYFFKKLLKEKCEVHFILEKIIIKNKKDLKIFFENLDLFSEIQKISNNKYSEKLKKFL